MEEKAADIRELFRRRAESLIAPGAQPDTDLSPQEIRTIVHELAVYQAELEIQNEELRTAQLNLEKMRDNYAALYHHSPAGYITLDSRGMITQHNRTFFSMCGCPPILVGMPLASLIVEEDRAVLLEQFKSFFASPEGKTIEVRLCSTGNRYLWVRLTGRQDNTETLPNEQEPDMTRLLVIVNDISAEKESRLALLGNIPAIVYRSSTRRGGIYYSPYVGEILGYAPDQLVESPNLWHDSIHPDDMAIVDAAVKEAVHGTGYDLEYRIRHASGNWKWVSDRSFSRTLQSGELLIDGIVHDVTSRKEAELALVRQEAWIRTVLEKAADAVFISDTHGRYTFVNQKAADLLGYSRDELLSLSMRELVPESQRYKAIAHFKAALAGARELIETEVICKDGRTIPVDVNAVKLPDGSVYTSCRDITGRKKAEKELRKAMEAAEAANRAKSEFLANMSHEIRTPLNGVIGMAQLLATSELDEEQKEFVEAIMTSGTSLLFLINDILDLSKIEAEKFVLESTEFNVRHCISDVLKAQQSLIGGKGVGLKTVIGATVPEMVIGDQLRLKQALLNLVGNAIKFTDTGSITVGAHVREQHGTTIILQLEVVDTGIGIAGEVMDQIFKPFMQADNSITRKYGGTGLGLAITQRLAELMGGSIALESVEGEGSTFRLLLPLTIPASSGSEVVAEGKREPSFNWDGPSLKILMAEDNEINRKYQSVLLAQMGHVVTAAENGKEALEAVEREEFDLALMDIQMPIMSGTEVVDRIRKAELLTNRHLPVIALTAYSLHDDEQRFREAGFDGYVAKPIEVETLVQQMKSVLGLPDGGTSST